MYELRTCGFVSCPCNNVTSWLFREGLEIKHFTAFFFWRKIIDFSIIPFPTIPTSTTPMFRPTGLLQNLLVRPAQSRRAGLAVITSLSSRNPCLSAMEGGEIDKYLTFIKPKIL